MTTYKGKQIKLLPTIEQEVLFWKSVGCRRFVYNWALHKQMEAFNNKEPFIDYTKLCKEIVSLKNNDPQFTWLKELSCDIPKQAIKDLDSAYKRYFKQQKQPGYVAYNKRKIEHYNRIGKSLSCYDRTGHPKFKKKLRCVESFHCDTVQVVIKQDYILIPKIGYVKIAKNGIFPQGKGKGDLNICNAKVKYNGKFWYFTASVPTDITPLNTPKTDAIGIDVGVKELAVCSNGTIYKNINKSKRVKRLEKHKRYLQRKISKKYIKNKKGNKYIKTKNIVKLENKLLNVNNHLKNIRKDYLHKVTSEIVKRNPIYVAMEDLNVAGMMKNKHLSKAIQDQGFNMFKNYISYKCNDHNIPLFLVDRFYPSSKTCSCCGNIKNNLKLSDRTYKCIECGLLIDRDLNASINIKQNCYGQYIKSINKAS